MAKKSKQSTSPLDNILLWAQKQPEFQRFAKQMNKENAVCKKCDKVASYVWADCLNPNCDLSKFLKADKR